jgi:hypothetical protein
MKKSDKTQSHKRRLQNFVVAPLTAAFALTDLLTYPYYVLLILVPLIIAEVVLIVFYLAKINKKNQPQPAAPAELPQTPQPVTPPKPPTVVIKKAEVSSGKLVFSVRKGIFRGRWVPVKENALAEFSAVEANGNLLAVTAKDETLEFVNPSKGASFVAFQEQVATLLEEQEKQRAQLELASKRRSDLVGLINASTRIVDASFNILLGLQQKRVNWILMEGYVDSLGGALNFWGPTVPPLSLDFLALNAAVKRQVPQDTSDEVLNVLRHVYGYFEMLQQSEDQPDFHPNLKDTQSFVSAYYTLNDMLFAKVVGAKENQKETAALQTALDALSKDTPFNLTFDAVTESLGRFGEIGRAHV